MTEAPESIRSRILDTAAQLFVRRGYDGIAMREIAEACGLSKAGIYYHFKDKEDLFLAILNQSLEELNEVTASAGQAGTARAQIEAFVRQIFTVLPPNRREIIRLANQEMGKLSPVKREDFGHRYEIVFLNPIGEMLARGITAGELRPHPPHLLVWGLLGLMYPFFSPGRAQTDAEAEAIVSLIISLFFDGAALDHTAP